MKNKKKHLQKEERFFIEKTLRTGKSIGYIAKLLDRGISTVSIEVSRNGGREVYDSILAQSRASQSQTNKKLNNFKLSGNKKLKNYVGAMLGRGLSAEIISKALRKRNLKNFYISPKGIRKYFNI